MILSLMHLLVGLGNIGKEYEFTRHNFGFLLLDQIIKDYHLSFQAKKLKSEIFSGEINGKKILAIKPQTFMNLSGQAVLEVINFFKIKPENILVMHDEVDFPLGKIKTKIGGGSAGHNGLKSIDQAIGENYLRLRLGVGRPENKNYSTADYVLGNFSEEEAVLVAKVNQKISDLLPYLLAGNANKFLNDFSL